MRAEIVAINEHIKKPSTYVGFNSIYRSFRPIHYSVKRMLLHHPSALNDVVNGVTLDSPTHLCIKSALPTKRHKKTRQ